MMMPGQQAWPTRPHTLQFPGAPVCSDGLWTQLMLLQKLGSQQLWPASPHATQIPFLQSSSTMVFERKHS
jgi:hypothetical protein